MIGTRRRLGAQLPARACVRQPWRRRDHRLPLRLTLCRRPRGEPGSASPAARAVPRRPARARPDRRSPRGEERQERGEPPHLADMIVRPHAGHRRTQHGARGALGDREGRLRPSARALARGRACNRPAHRSSVASQGRGGGGPGALRRARASRSGTTGAPGDHRPRGPASSRSTRASAPGWSGRWRRSGPSWRAGMSRRPPRSRGAAARDRPRKRATSEAGTATDLLSWRAAEGARRLRCVPTSRCPGTPTTAPPRSSPSSVRVDDRQPHLVARCGPRSPRAARRPTTSLPSTATIMSPPSW